jgi:hypothetical protein
MHRINWKTSFFGIAAILGGIASIMKGQTLEGVTAIISGLGLAAAKDHNNK